MTGRGRKGLRALIVGGALLVAASQVAPLVAAPSGITWGILRRGTLNNKGYSRANAAQSTAFSFDGTNTNQYSIYSQDFDQDGGTGYAWPYCAAGKPTADPADCPWQVAVYFEHSINGGATWTDKAMLNDYDNDGYADEDGSRVAVCAEGANVYTIWATQKEYYTAKVGSGARALRFRSNTNYGNSAAWNPVMALTDLTAQIDSPSISCANGSIYITYTDSKTGKIHLRISSDSGATWSDKVVAKSTAMLKGPYPYGPGGYAARPMIGVSDDGFIKDGQHFHRRRD